MRSSKDPDFGATGQFELTGVYHSDRKADATFATTLGMERIKSLLLLGAGEAHLQVLVQLAKHRRSDLDVTLVTPWCFKTSAAMAVGYVAGDHALSDCQINLENLVANSGVRWISARCSGLDAATSTVMLDYGAHGATVSGQRTSSLVGRPAVLTADVLSIDTGTVLERKRLEAWLPGAFDHALHYKPTEQFINRWTQVVNQAKSQPGSALRVCVVGAGTPGVELCFAIRHGLKRAGVEHRVHLVTHDNGVASDQPISVQKRVVAMLKKQGITVIEARCLQVSEQGLRLSGSTTLEAQAVVLAMGDEPPEWLAHSGLAVDSMGRVEVNSQLQSTSHRRVFTTGSVAALAGQPHAKPGINGQWAGHDLALNLMATLSDQPLNKHTPANNNVSFVNCGGEHAIAGWGPISSEGHWAWQLKRRQDKALLASYEL